jgi:hypothetical protein
MAKELIKAAGKAALESTLQQLLPTLLKRFDELQQQMTNLVKHVDEKFERTNEEISKLRRDADVKFERTQEVINELGLRINTTATKVDTFLEFVRRDSAKVDMYMERLVRVEEEQKHRRRRAG